MKRPNAASKALGSSKRNTRLNVSWLGMPCSSVRIEAQQGLLGQPEFLHLAATGRAAQRRQKSDEDDLDKFMTGIVCPWIDQVAKTLVERVHRHL